MKQYNFAMNRIFLLASDKLYSAARWCEGNAIRHRGKALFVAIPPRDVLNDVFHEPDPSERIRQVERIAKGDERVADALIAGFNAGKMVSENPKPPDPKRVKMAEKAALPCTMESRSCEADDVEPYGRKRRCRCGEALVDG